MIADSNPAADAAGRMGIVPMDDMTYNNNGWIAQVQEIVAFQCQELELPDDPKIGLIGCNKDSSSFYLKLFPTWDFEDVSFLDNLNASDIRDTYFSVNPASYHRMVPQAVDTFLEYFRETPTMDQLMREFYFVEQYKLSVQKYPRIEHTVDAVVVQSGHVLLIRRRAKPGKGQWAIPGGFVNPDEFLVDAMIRELREETKIKVPEPVLRGSIVTQKTYDDPYRSARGRIITQAFYMKLQDQTSLPKIKGSDDADKAKWVPLSELEPTNMFEDHFWIIQDMLGELS